MSSNGIRRMKKALRKLQAEERNAMWHVMSPADQLADLNARGERAIKQRAKIQARIEAVQS